MYPLDREYEGVISHIEESLGNLYLFQLKQSEAAHWYHRALNAVSQLIDNSVEAGDITTLMETKGEGGKNKGEGGKIKGEGGKTKGEGGKIKGEGGEM